MTLDTIIALVAIAFSSTALALGLRRMRLPSAAGPDPTEVARQAVVASAQLHKGRTDDAVNQDMARAAMRFLMERAPSVSAENARMLIELAVAESKK